MEIHFQPPAPAPAPGKNAKSRTRAAARGSRGHAGVSGSRFLGVRQRRSGRWVAEIKDTTQKIRMWLGTFETAEAAAHAYDEAACLLRGANTRTNFVPRAVSPNSAVAARIRALLNNKKPGKSPAAPPPPPPSAFVPPAPTAPISSPSASTTASTVTIRSNVSNSTGSGAAAVAPGETQVMLMTGPDNVYRPCFSAGTSDQLHPGTSAPSDLSWLFEPAGIERLPAFTQEGAPEMSAHGVEAGNGGCGEGLPELEKMKVGRQISASLCTINGVHEYLEAVHDPSDGLWDLPPLCQLFCQS